MNPDKAKQGGSAIPPGNYLVTAACFRNMKTDFKPNQLNLACTLAVLDKDGDLVRGADPEEIAFGFGEKSHDAFTPGNSKSIDDAEPEDMGPEVNVEGNTVYCSGDEQFNSSCGAIVFLTSLTNLGFPKELCDKTWAESLVGLKFTLDQLEAKDVNAKFNTRLNTRPLKDGGTVTYKIATKWLNPKYLSNPATTESATAKNGSAAAAPVSGAKTAEEIAVMCMNKVAAMRRGPKLLIKSVGSLAGFFVNAFASNGYAKLGQELATVRAFVENTDWTTAKLLEMGADVEFDPETGAWTGKVVFPLEAKA